MRFFFFAYFFSSWKSVFGFFKNRYAKISCLGCATLWGRPIEVSVAGFVESCRHFCIFLPSLLPKVTHFPGVPLSNFGKGFSFKMCAKMMDFGAHFAAPFLSKFRKAFRPKMCAKMCYFLKKMVRKWCHFHVRQEWSFWCTFLCKIPYQIY